MIVDYLAKLNADQRRAVEHGTADQAPAPLLFIAGAGTGKTNTLAHRVAHLIANGVDPRRILLLTFSRRAAVEMTRRVQRIVTSVLGTNSAVATAALSWSGTFHAIGARLLREYANIIGLDPSFTILDRGDAADLINLIRHDLGFSKTETRFPMKGTCLDIYSHSVNSEMALDAVLWKAFPWCRVWETELRLLFAKYVEAKQRQNVLDYDDLLLFWSEMAAEPFLMADIQKRFDHVLVDEYQDTNALQARILLGIKPHGRGLTVVGDDAQSIYSFRAATVRNILDFPDQFTPSARVVTLEQNYRSTQSILHASNAVIGLTTERFTKKLWSEKALGTRPMLVSVRDANDQGSYVVERILENREAGVDLKRQAVLFRASHHSAELELELTRRKIPFIKFGGLKFLESAHVKDVIACLRWAENPRDRIAGFRVLRLLPGIGSKTAGSILERVDGLNPTAALVNFSVPARAVDDWNVFVDLLRQLWGANVSWPADLEIVRRWYEPHLNRIYQDDADARRADLLQLEQIALGYSSRERFLTELTLDPPHATSAEADAPMLDEDYLVLSTIHSAKGQEWKVVFLLNGVDGCIPSDLATGTTDEIEEERRLLYVAMTRAKDDLQIIVPHRFYTYQQRKDGDRHLYACRTRFIPDSLLTFFDRLEWHVESTYPTEAAVTRSDLSVDLGARIRARWR